MRPKSALQPLRALAPSEIRILLLTGWIMAGVNTEHGNLLRGESPRLNTVRNYVVRFGYELLEISPEVVDSIGRSNGGQGRNRADSMLITPKLLILQKDKTDKTATKPIPLYVYCTVHNSRIFSGSLVSGGGTQDGH